MINLTAQLDADLAALSGKQLPFITSMALNQTAADARETVRKNLPKRFTLRNSWTLRGIQSWRSDKRNLVAKVTAPGYMAIQESGGVRQPDSSRYLASPGDALRTGRIIPKGKRPRALLASGKAFIADGRNGGAGVFLRKGRKGKQIQLLYWLTDTQTYDDRFEFEADVSNQASQSFGSNFLQAFAKYGTR